MRLENLSPTYQAQARLQLGQIASRVLTQPPAPIPAQPPAKAPKQSKTELAYQREVLDPQVAAGAIKSVQFEALTFRLDNGHRYTPDWVCLNSKDQTVCIEVKGSYRLGSYQRARLAFDQAKVEWPSIIWIWAERQKDGSWRMS